MKPLTNNSRPQNVGVAKVLGTHLHVAKVNILIVEVGTLCQPGEVTSGERQPEYICICKKRKTRRNKPNQYSTQRGESRARERLGLYGRTD